MNYEIAIPSYKRAKTLKNKTLAMLQRHNIDLNRVIVFVADQEEFDEYSKEIGSLCNIKISQPTLRGSRNFIRKFYPAGTQVVNFDDDIIEVLYAKDEKTLAPVEDLEAVIKKGFDLCHQQGAYIWGVYAASNPFFMKKEKSVGLYYIIGSMWGHIIRHDKDLMLTLEDKEDFERTLQYYSKDGVVVRLDNITVKSNYYKEPGGMQETRTSERITESAKYLVDKYPGLCTMYVRATTGHAELKLRDTREKIPENNLSSFFG